MNARSITPLIRLLTLFLLIPTAPNTWGQTPNSSQISFQGLLNGADGKPLPSGTYDLTFRFWDAPAPAGKPISPSMPIPSTPVTAGLVSATLPVESTWFNGSNRYLAVSINGGPELLPRLPINSVPYATHFTGNPLTVRGPGAYLCLENTKESSASPDTCWGIDSGGWDRHGTFSVWRRIHGDVPYPLLYSDAEAKTFAVGPAVPELNAQYFPGYRFQVCGQRAADIRLVAYQAPGAGWWSIDPNAFDQGYFQVLRWNDATSPTSMLCIDRGGNVGVGTRTPETRLDVHGTTRTTVLEITSDRAVKTEFAPVDSLTVLKKLVALPITTWAYTNSPTTRHMGPVAQDFASSFALGTDDKHIASIDADGVAFAAVQGLHQLLADQKELLKTQAAEIRELRHRLEALEAAPSNP